MRTSEASEPPKSGVGASSRPFPQLALRTLCLQGSRRGRHHRPEVIGLLWVFPHGLAMAGAHGDSISYVFKNAAWHVVEQGVGGIVIGLVYGKLLGR